MFLHYFDGIIVTRTSYVKPKILVVGLNLKLIAAFDVPLSPEYVDGGKVQIIDIDIKKRQVLGIPKTRRKYDFMRDEISFFETNMYCTYDGKTEIFDILTGKKIGDTDSQPKGELLQIGGYRTIEHITEYLPIFGQNTKNRETVFWFAELPNGMTIYHNSFGDRYFNLPVVHVYAESDFIHHYMFIG